MNIKYIISLTLFLSQLYSFSSSILINDHNKTFNDGSIILTINSSYDVHGIQFKINYNINELNLNNKSIISIMPDLDLFINNNNKGSATIAILNTFNDKLFNITPNDTLNFIKINFESQNEFTGISKIEFVDILIIGEYGAEIPTIKKIDYELLYFNPNKSSLNNIITLYDDINTSIRYQVSSNLFVEIMIYDKKGQIIKTLIKENHKAGYYTAIWDATDQFNNIVKSGKYMVKMKTQNIIDTKIITFIHDE